MQLLLDMKSTISLMFSCDDTCRVGGIDTPQSLSVYGAFPARRHDASLLFRK
jgi:hypothetical protein